ncbi:hypothetical protein NVP1284A_67 [Vibrio phage 1.284.A._10N.286.55.A5]|nr:hypothetical protein NVP1284A_67 [Vibrio phage 1.284.A._10N.286.55.A5]
MTTYKTYQEAKIAMPLACIIHDTEDDIFFGMPSREGTTLNDDGCKFAEPQDYCMTVDKFLADGNKFSDGDVVVNREGLVKRPLGDIVRLMNIPSKYDVDSFILRAAVLEDKELELTKDDSPQGVISAISNRLHNMGCEHQDSALGEELGSMACDIWGVLPLISNESIEEKKPRTKVEYGPCHFADAWEPVKAYCNGDELFDGDKNKVACPEVALNLWIHGNLYKCIEAPMTERDEFVEALQSVWIIDGVDGKEQLEKIVDSGPFKLVN